MVATASFQALPKKNAMNDGPIVIRAPVKTEEQKRQGYLSIRKPGWLFKPPKSNTI